MTLKDKIIAAKIFAMHVKSMADSLERDAHDFDVRFPLSTAKSMHNAADELLKKLK